jgi:alpha-beta hydrolase superfamily lysophospholipase
MQALRTADGLKLHLRTWSAAGPARGMVLIVHGLGEHIGRYEHVAAALNAAGWHVAGFDQRGHGASEGARGSLPRGDALLTDLARVMDHLQEHWRGHAGAGVPRHVLLGHSMGGLVAARFVAESFLPQPAAWTRRFDALVLSSPALDTGMNAAQRALIALLLPLLPGLRVGNGLDPAWVCRDPAVVQAYAADPLVHDRITPRLARFFLDAAAVVQQAAPRWRLPTLVMWAGADRCVRAAGSEAFAAAAAATGQVTARPWPGLAHEIFNEPEQRAVLATLTQWLGGI